MKSSVLFMVAALALAAGAVPRTAGAAPALPAHKSKVVYQATFAKTKLKGWNTLGTTWHVSKSGVVQFVQSNDGEGVLLAPFSTAKLHDFRVTAGISAGGTIDPAQTPSLGIIVRRVGSGGREIIGGAYFSPSAAYNRPLLYWGGSYVGGADVPLKPGYNTYRLDVHGTDYHLSINGKPAVAFSIPDYANGHLVGIDVWNLPVRVKSFTVTRLSPATPLPAEPPLRAVNLQVGDVPPALTFEGSYYGTPDVASALFTGASSGPAVPGLRLFHQTGYALQAAPSPGALAVISSGVFAYDSRADTQASLASLWTGAQAGAEGVTNVTTTDLSGLGDEAHAATADFTSTLPDGSAITLTQVLVLFRRGDYVFDLYLDFIAGPLSRSDMLAQATAFARVLDGRAQAAG